MSEEQQPNETTQLVNNDLTDRVNKAFIANGYTLLNGGTDNVVMIAGEKNDKQVDILLTLEGICELAEQLKAEADEKGKKLSNDNS